MKFPIFKTVLVLLVVSSTVSCQFNTIRGKGPVVEKEVQFPENFNRVSVQDGLQIKMHKSDQPRVVLHAEKNIMPYIIDTVVAGKLSLRIKSGVALSGTLKATVYCNKLVQIEASSGSKVHGKSPLQGDSLKVVTSSGAKMTLHLNMEKTKVRAFSGSAVKLLGVSTRFDGKASSGSMIVAGKLRTKRSRVKVNSGGTIGIFASRELSARASSGGSITYYGAPQKTEIHSSVGSSISSGD